MAKRFKKGSKAARAHMAKLRAMQGGKRKRRTTRRKKAAAPRRKRRSSLAGRRSPNPAMRTSRRKNPKRRRRSAGVVVGAKKGRKVGYVAGKRLDSDASQATRMPRSKAMKLARRLANRFRSWQWFVKG